MREGKRRGCQEVKRVRWVRVAVSHEDGGGAGELLIAGGGHDCGKVQSVCRLLRPTYSGARISRAGPALAVALALALALALASKPRASLQAPGQRVATLRVAWLEPIVKALMMSILQADDQREWILDGPTRSSSVLTLSPPEIGACASVYQSVTSCDQSAGSCM